MSLPFCSHPPSLSLLHQSNTSLTERFHFISQDQVISVDLLVALLVGILTVNVAVYYFRLPRPGINIYLIFSLFLMASLSIYMVAFWMAHMRAIFAAPSYPFSVPFYPAHTQVLALVIALVFTIYKDSESVKLVSARKELEAKLAADQEEILRLNQEKLDSEAIRQSIDSICQFNDLDSTQLDQQTILTTTANHVRLLSDKAKGKTPMS